MDKTIVLVFLLLAIISLTFVISATCEEGQIDINTASLEELDKIIWVGKPTAEKIINARPFGSIDELVKVSGIAEGKLADIKEQGLACVDEEESEDETTEINEEKKESIPASALIVEEEETMKTEQLDTINLSTKDIKSENNNENSEKNRYAVYGLVAFCFLLGLLFAIKKIKSRKDELE